MEKLEVYEKIKEAWESILHELQMLGLNLDDPNFHGTPERIAKMLVYEKCAGLNSKEKCKELLGKRFPTEYDGMVVLNPIKVWSMCAHHWVDVVYQVFMGYIPKNKEVIGISKIPRVIKLFASQPTIQEQFTKDLTDLFIESIDPEGIGLIVRGQHNCMVARGIQQPDVWITTSEMRGTFRINPSLKEEFLLLCGLK